MVTPTRPPKFIPLLLALLTVTSVGSSAFAQQNVKTESNLQFDDFEPQANQGANILNTASSDLTPHLKLGAGIFFHYIDSPVKLEPYPNAQSQKNGESAYLVYSQFKGELGFSFGLFNYAELGLVLPLAYQEGANVRNVSPKFLPYAPDKVFMIQDLRLSAKGRLIDPKAEWAHGLGVALQVTGYFPIPGVKEGSEKLTNQWNSFYTGGKGQSYGSSLRVEPRLIVDWRHKEDGVKVAANFAYQYRPKRTFGENYITNQELRWNLGVEVPIGWGLEWLRPEATFYGNYPFDTGVKKKQDRIAPANVNMEWEAGVKFMLPYDLVGQIGGGGPLIHQGLGTPKFRVFAGFGYYPTASAPIIDTDQDGLLDNVDSCPLIPGPTENQGCPWGDLDNDGILDNVDQCPSQAEDFDGFEDEDGCPDLDNDNDGIPDTQDKCPNEAEDMDGFQDDDGCPDPDNDNDGLADTEDKCPNEAEIYNGVEDDDGCPDKGPTKLRITETKIEILEKVFFNTGKAKIRSRSFDLLDQVASVLKNIKKITKLRIEGHTDSRGSARSNMKLSQARADSVRQYLIDKGIDPGRLEAKGYGEDMPIDTNKTKAGRERNRRVEFTIVEVNGKPVQTDSVTVKTEEEVK